MTFTKRELAEAILFAAKLREESYIKDTGLYAVQLGDACIRACKAFEIDSEMSRPMCLLLQLGWNDVLAWATAIAKT